MCAVVAVEKLYADYGARVAKLPDVQEGLGELMGYVKWGLMRDGRIPPEGEREGVEGLLRFADGMFEKAVRWERVLVGGGKRSARGSADWGTVKRLYFNAWEFFGVVSWMEKKRNGVGAGFGVEAVGAVHEKARYATWRATEIFKAGKEGREVDVRGVTLDGDGDISGAVGGESGVSELPYVAHSEETQSQSHRTQAKKKSRTLRQARAFAVGDEVWYSAALRGCSRVKGTVMRVGWNDVEGVLEYDVVEAGGQVRNGVRGEACAPSVKVGDCIVVGEYAEDGEEGKQGDVGYEDGLVEEVYFSSWPPKYLCMVAGGLEEVEDVCLYFDKADEGALMAELEKEEEKEEEEEEEKEEEEEEEEEKGGTGVCDAEETGLEEGNSEQGGAETPTASEPRPFLPPAPSANPPAVEGNQSTFKQGTNDLSPADTIPPAADVKESKPESLPPPPEAPEAPEAPAAPAGKKTPSSRLKDDVVSMNKAEKLAKSAISCISFGDAPSAVRFLQEAIDALTK